MFAGHFALAAAAKSREPKVPLWSLMLGTQLLDVLFVPLFVSGIETIEPLGTGYGEAVIHADYTHSLVGALLIAAVVGGLARRAWGKRSGLTLGAVVFSHWLLDLLVHRADLPILPGNLGHLPLLGFGLWSRPAVSIAMEGMMAVTGAILYWRSTQARSAGPAGSRAALTAAAVTGTLLLLSIAASVTGLA